MSTPIILLLVIMVGGILLGFPIVWAMMSGCIACLMLEPNLVLTIVPQKVFLGLNNFAFLAIPCFLLCGDIMARGGLSRRLCDFCNALVGWLKGGLSIVAIIACAIFAAISGSAVATTAAIGGIMHPEMVKRGYSSPYSAALPAVAGTLGIIIPPSIVFVIYGNITGTSISQLLMAGVVPGVLCAAALCVLAYIIARRRSYEVDQMFSWRGLGQSFLRSVFALLMPLIILGGIYAGICTPTESSAIACLYGAIVCFVAYHDLTFKSFCKVLESTAVSVSTLMLLVVTAQVVGFLSTYYSIPTTVACGQQDGLYPHHHRNYGALWHVPRYLCQQSDPGPNFLAHCRHVWHGPGSLWPDLCIPAGSWTGYSAFRYLPLCELHFE